MEIKLEEEISIMQAEFREGRGTKDHYRQHQEHNCGEQGTSNATVSEYLCFIDYTQKHLTA